MDNSFIPPRLRLTRHRYPKTRMDATYDTTPVAGPSRISPEINGHAFHEDEEDAESTPRLTTIAKLASERNSPVNPAPPALPETPASRLRALLARVPNNPTPASTSRAPLPQSPPDVTSDFESVSGHSTQPSLARESLKQLFSRALRDPGDTPRKSSARRNSIDTSEVEDSPRIERVRQERASNRGKRKSLSDEEAEKATQHSRSDDTSRPPAAVAYDALRQRLAHSSSKLSAPQPQLVDADSDMSLSDADIVPDVNEDTATLLRDLTGSRSTPPAATSTPLRSMQMPSQLQMHSNLLDQDSEMQRAMKSMESSEGDSFPTNPKRFSFPSGRGVNGIQTSPAPSRPLSWSSHSKSHSTHNLPLARRVSEELDSSSSRASSSMSSADYHDRQKDSAQERMHERERKWNKPNGKSPSHTPGTPERTRHQSLSSPSYNSSHTIGRASPIRGLARKLSTASLQSLDEHGSGSRASSVSSRSEHRERIKEEEEEKNKERERLWNRPNVRPRTSSSLSSSGFQSPQDRTRTYSQPARPNSSQSHLTPERHSLSRHQSLSSMSSSSRAGSPASSIASGRDPEEKVITRIVEHERERNWNAPHPKWTPHRSISPLPSPTHSRSPSALGGSFGRSNGRMLLDESFPGRPSPSRDKLTDMLLDVSPEITAKTRTRAGSVSTNANGKTRLSRKSNDSSHPEPSLSTTPQSDPKAPGFTSRFGWQFPKNRAPLPPLEKDSPERPSSAASDRPSSVASNRPSSRLSTSNSAFVSHIPVRSPSKKDKEREGSKDKGKGKERASSSSPSSDSQRKRGHKRTVTEFSESVGALPPSINIQSEPEPELEPVPIVNGNGAASHDEIHPSDQESISATSTPIAKPVPLPAATPPDTPPVLNQTNGHTEPSSNASLQPETSLAASSQQEEEPHVSSVLQTPPRRSFTNTSKLEFQTPSPPKNMPELPGPPLSSSEDDNEEDEERTPVNLTPSFLGNMTTMNKTPKPPGAWVATPAATKFDRDLLHRPSSTPPEKTSSLLDGPSSIMKRPSTLSKATPAGQTPAPPGAWIPTPGGTAKRKSVLKVRFDVETGDISSDFSGIAEIPVVSPSDPQPILDASNPLLDSTARQQANGSAAPHVKLEVESSVEEPIPDPVKPKAVRSPKSPSIRVLDAFGNETKDEPIPSPEPEWKKEEANDGFLPPMEETKKPTKVKQQKDSHKDKKSSSRNTSKIRIVDAMGREIEDPELQEMPEIPMVSPEPHFDLSNITEDDIPSTPLTHNEALARVRQTIAHLADDLNEVDRSYDDLSRDQNRIDALQDASKAARNARQRITESLDLVKSAEDDLKKKFGALREGMNKSKLLPSVEQPRASSWNILNMWTIAFLVIVQLVVLVLAYRHSKIEARNTFLARYYNPFDPDLFLHITDPYTINHSIPSAHSYSWSIFSIPDTLAREGWRGVASEVWGNVTGLAHDIQRNVWNAWANSKDYGIPSWDSWPPT
ncbi:hypothetical protein K474DRAFT_1668701 [Panus rudis PR-1116 ss-1]|nr:hypothetical protein K474DRAFT_1668701 [Panus rudis PR-1116 ss-1]